METINNTENMRALIQRKNKLSPYWDYKLKCDGCTYAVKVRFVNGKSLTTRKTSVEDLGFHGDCYGCRSYLPYGVFNACLLVV